MPQEILPPLPAVVEPGANFAPDPAIDPEDLPPELAFTPAPQRSKRWTGITAAKQRAFIAHLAATGAVTMAAKAIGHSGSALYQLRKRAGAESFAAAWDKAVEMGARRVLDMLLEHAIHGVPETLSKDGQVILERRKFNTRAMMWIVQQRFPEQYGGSLESYGSAPHSLPDGLRKLRDRWRREWEEEQGEAAAEAEARDPGPRDAVLGIVARIAAIRRAFLEGIVPDPVKRAAWELLVGPADWPAIAAAAAGEAPWDEPQRSMHDPAMIVSLAAPDPYDEDGDEDGAPIAAALAETEPERRAAFEAALDGPRPVFQRPHGFLARNTISGGPTAMDRLAARHRAERAIDELERQWNAAYSEETWAAWKAGGHASPHGAEGSGAAR
ncbi:hypothetical protein [Sphingopyxis sp.]|uniref:hypothetical protein n=1 Tax=Sphingopyxis sp. TaxID=1908224 RepID=UPI002D7832A7|nr:hypothetical protein [Sphingopyxis sp.]HET6524750.1 hypothetical protein [Sphingopyxis sp.]